MKNAAHLETTERGLANGQRTRCTPSSRSPLTCTQQVNDNPHRVQRHGHLVPRLSRGAPQEDSSAQQAVYLGARSSCKTAAPTLTNNTTAPVSPSRVIQPQSQGPDTRPLPRFYRCPVLPPSLQGWNSVTGEAICRGSGAHLSQSVSVVRKKAPPTPPTPLPSPATTSSYFTPKQSLRRAGTSC